MDEEKRYNCIYCYCTRVGTFGTESAVRKRGGSRNLPYLMVIRAGRAGIKKIKAAYIYYNIKKDGWMRGGAFCEKPGLT